MPAHPPTCSPRGSWAEEGVMWVTKEGETKPGLLDSTEANEFGTDVLNTGVARDELDKPEEVFE